MPKEHKYPRKWAAVDDGKIVEDTLLCCDGPGLHLYHLRPNGGRTQLENLYEDYAETSVGNGRRVEIFNEPREVLKQFERREAVVYLKGVIKQMRETHQIEIARLRSEIEQLESRLAQADLSANGG